MFTRVEYYCQQRLKHTPGQWSHMWFYIDLNTTSADPFPMIPHLPYPQLIFILNCIVQFSLILCNTVSFVTILLCGNKLYVFCFCICCTVHSQIILLGAETRSWKTVVHVVQHLVKKTSETQSWHT
jgi:hypothetical protein